MADASETSPSDGQTPEALTLQAAAEHLSVHYMTAYRYVRLGLLPAHRKGRSWVVLAQDLQHFQAERREPAGARRTRSGSGGPAAGWADRLEQRLLAGDRGGALGVLESALASGADPVDVYIDVIAPAMVAIGDGWEAGSVEVSVEHRASVIATHCLAVLSARFTRRGVSRGVVVIGAVEGERHGLPVSLVADTVRLAGFEVHDLGVDVPVDSFAAVIGTSDRLVAVGVSVTGSEHLGTASRTVAALRDAIARWPQPVPVFVGGAALADAEAARRLGADCWAADARAVVELLDGLTGGSAGTG